MVPLFCPILVEKDRSVFLVQRMKGHMRSKCLWFALRLLHVVEEMEGKGPSVQLRRRMDTIPQPIEGCQGSHKWRNTLISKFKNPGHRVCFWVAEKEHMKCCRQSTFSFVTKVFYQFPASQKPNLSHSNPARVQKPRYIIYSLPFKWQNANNIATKDVKL